MTLMRKVPGSITVTIRKITNAGGFAHHVTRPTLLGSAHLAAKTVPTSLQNRTPFAADCQTKTYSLNLPTTNIRNKSNSQFTLPPGGKCVLKSESSALAKAFSSFNLGSLSVSFAGFLGDFAVWAILDAFTGEITYLVDDNA
jgi:hypothetical protein